MLRKDFLAKVQQQQFFEDQIELQASLSSRNNEKLLEDLTSDSKRSKFVV